VDTLAIGGVLDEGSHGVFAERGFLGKRSESFTVSMAAVELVLELDLGGEAHAA
jgi:hypothetical protein